MLHGNSSPQIEEENPRAYPAFWRERLGGSSVTWRQLVFDLGGDPPCCALFFAQIDKNIQRAIATATLCEAVPNTRWLARSVLGRQQAPNLTGPHV